MCKWKFLHNTLTVFLLLGSIFFCGCPDAKDRFVPTLPPQPPAAPWTYRIGGESYDYGVAACMDESGNVYVAGCINGTNIDFAEDWGGGDTKPCGGQNDAFITKICPSGEYLWTHTMGGYDNDWATAVCTDQNGNVYVAGRFESTVNFGADWGRTDSKTAIGIYDTFITKMGPNGMYCWTRKIGGNDYDYPAGICADRSGNIYVAGLFWSYTVNFAQDWGETDVKTRTSTNSAPDAFITKIERDGGYGWTRRIGGAGMDYAKAVCVDRDGKVYVAGCWRDTVDFAQDWGGNDERTSRDDYYHDVFITKIGPGGAYLWTHTIASTGQETANCICTDRNGDVYIAGGFSGIVNFGEDWGAVDTKTSATTDYDPGGGPPFVHPTYEDIFITKIDANDNYCWTRRMGGFTQDAAYAIDADASGNVYVTGVFSELLRGIGDTVNFAEDWGGSDIKTTAGKGDVFITRIDAAGDYCWTHRTGWTEHDEGRALCTDELGNVYVAGSFFLTVNFAEDWGDTQVKTSAGYRDVFIMKIVQP